MEDFKVSVKLEAVQADITDLRSKVEKAFAAPISVKFDTGDLGKSGGTASMKSGFASLNTVLAQSKVNIDGVQGARRRLSVESAQAIAIDKANTAAKINDMKVEAARLVLTDKQTSHARRRLQEEGRTYRERTREITNFSKMSDEANRYYTQFSKNIGKNSALNARWQSTMTRLADPMSFAGKTTADRTSGARAELAQLMNESEKAGVSIETLGQRLNRLFGAHLNTALVMGALHALQQSLVGIYKNVVEVNTALTQFQIVSQVSGGELSTFAKDAFASARKISASATDVVDAATVYKRLGYSTQDSLKFSELTTMYSKVGDVDMSSAEDNITAIVKAFDLSSTDLQGALDKMVYVGNNFPISASQLGEGLNNAASSLAAGGNTLEQSIALLTSAMTTTQDISKASTGLRTITARIRNTGVELNDLGEELEDDYNTIPKYREQLMSLSGVDILDGAGQFRATYDIISDLADVWGTLDSQAQAAITTMVAGEHVRPYVQKCA